MGDLFGDAFAEESVHHLYGRDVSDRLSQFSFSDLGDLAISKSNNVSFLKVDDLDPSLRNILVVGDSFICYSVTAKRTSIRAIDTISGEKALLKGHESAILDLKSSVLDRQAFCSVDHGSDPKKSHVFVWKRATDKGLEFNLVFQSKLQAKMVQSFPNGLTWGISDEHNIGLLTSDQANVTHYSQLRCNISLEDEIITAFAFSPNGKHVAGVVTNDRGQQYLQVWKYLENGDALKVYDQFHNQLRLSGVVGLSFLADCIVTVSRDDQSFGNGDSVRTIPYSLKFWSITDLSLGITPSQPPRNLQTLLLHVPEYSFRNNSTSLANPSLECDLRMEPTSGKYLLLSSRKSNVLVCLALSPPSQNAIPVYHVTYLDFKAPIVSMDVATILDRDHHSAEHGEHVEVTAYQEEAADQSSIQQYHILSKSLFDYKSYLSGRGNNSPNANIGNGSPISRHSSFSSSPKPPTETKSWGSILSRSQEAVAASSSAPTTPSVAPTADTTGTKSDLPDFLRNVTPKNNTPILSAFNRIGSSNNMGIASSAGSLNAVLSEALQKEKDTSSSLTNTPLPPVSTPTATTSSTNSNTTPANTNLATKKLLSTLTGNSPAGPSSGSATSSPLPGPSAASTTANGGGTSALLSVLGKNAKTPSSSTLANLVSASAATAAAAAPPSASKPAETAATSVPSFASITAKAKPAPIVAAAATTTPATTTTAVVPPTNAAAVVPGGNEKPPLTKTTAPPAAAATVVAPAAAAVSMLPTQQSQPPAVLPIPPLAAVSTTSVASSSLATAAPVTPSSSSSSSAGISGDAKHDLLREMHHLHTTTITEMRTLLYQQHAVAQRNMQDMMTQMKSELTTQMTDTLTTKVQQQLSNKLKESMRDTIRDTIRSYLQDAFRNAFESSLLPAFQSGIDRMFEQVNSSVDDGMEGVLTVLQEQHQEAVDARAQVVSTVSETAAALMKNQQQMASSAAEGNQVAVTPEMLGSVMKAVINVETMWKRTEQTVVQLQTMMEQMHAVTLAMAQQQQQNQAGVNSGLVNGVGVGAAPVVAVAKKLTPAELLGQGKIADAIIAALDNKNVDETVAVLAHLTPAVVIEKCSPLVRLCITQQLASDLSVNAPNEGIAKRLEWIKSLVVTIVRLPAPELDANVTLKRNFPRMIQAVLESIQAAKEWIARAQYDNGEDENVSIDIPHSVHTDLQLLEIVVQSASV